MRNDFPQKEKGCQFRIPDSRFQILSLPKYYKNMADSNYKAHVHRLLPLLRWVRTIATWKTVI